MTRVAISGFGRVGRCFLRAARQRHLDLDGHSIAVLSEPGLAIVDSGLTSVVDGTQVKVVAWYDNEWGYSSRLVDVAQRLMAHVPQQA